MDLQTPEDLGEYCASQRDRSRKTKQSLDNVRGVLRRTPLVSLAHHQLWVSSFHVSFSPWRVKCEVGVAAVITQTRWELPKKTTDSDRSGPKDHSEVPDLTLTKHTQQQIMLYWTINKVCDSCNTVCSINISDIDLVLQQFFLVTAVKQSGLDLEVVFSSEACLWNWGSLRE